MYLKNYMPVSSIHKWHVSRENIDLFEAGKLSRLLQNRFYLYCCDKFGVKTTRKLAAMLGLPSLVGMLKRTFSIIVRNPERVYFLVIHVKYLQRFTCKNKLNMFSLMVFQERHHKQILTIFRSSIWQPFYDIFFFYNM